MSFGRVFGSSFRRLNARREEENIEEEEVNAWKELSRLLFEIHRFFFSKKAKTKAQEKKVGAEKLTPGNRKRRLLLEDLLLPDFIYRERRV